MHVEIRQKQSLGEVVRAEVRHDFAHRSAALANTKVARKSISRVHPSPLRADALCNRFRLQTGQQGGPGGSEIRALPRGIVNMLGGLGQDGHERASLCLWGTGVIGGRCFENGEQPFHQRRYISAGIEID